MTDFALQVLAGGTAEVGHATVITLAWIIVAFNVIVFGAGFLLLFRALGRHKVPRPPMPDDTQAAPWPDGDTIVADGLGDELARMLAEEDQR